MTELTWGFFSKVPDEVLNKIFQEDWDRCYIDPMFATPYQTWVCVPDSTPFENLQEKISADSLKLKEEGFPPEVVKISTCLNL